MSPTRLKIVRGILALGMLLALFWAVANFVFPRQLHESLSKEPFVSSVHMDMTIVGTFALTWVAAIVIALRDPAGNRGLVRAVMIGAAILFFGALYEELAINPSDTSPITWVTMVVLLVVSLSLAVAYPRRS